MNYAALKASLSAINWSKIRNSNWTITIVGGIIVAVFSYFFLGSDPTLKPTPAPIGPNPPIQNYRPNELRVVQKQNLGTAGDCTVSTSLISKQHVRVTATRASGSNDSPKECASQSFVDYTLDLKDRNPDEKVSFKISAKIYNSEIVDGGIQLLQTTPQRLHVYEFQESGSQIIELLNKQTYRFQLITAVRALKGENSGSSEVELELIR